MHRSDAEARGEPPFLKKKKENGVTLLNLYFILFRWQEGNDPTEKETVSHFGNQ